MSIHFSILLMVIISHILITFGDKRLTVEIQLQGDIKKAVNNCNTTTNQK